MHPEQFLQDPYEGLLGTVGGHTMAFQDLLNAGYNLKEVEDISNSLMDGEGPVTIARMAALRGDPVFGEVAARSITYALGRIRRQFY